MFSDTVSTCTVRLAGCNCPYKSVVVTVTVVSVGASTTFQYPWSMSVLSMSREVKGTRIRMLRVSDPSPNTLLISVTVPVPPSVPEAAQPVAKAGHVRVRQPAMAVPKQDEPEKTLRVRWWGTTCVIIE